MEIVQSFIVKNPCYVKNVNVEDWRYELFQTRGPVALMLHSVGCAQPSAQVFAKRWNNANYEVSVHAFIDANNGEIWQIMPWNYRAWHCGGSANNTHIGVEMCESAHIRYLEKGEPGYAPAKFEILDRTKAVEDCMRAYHSAVELFAMLCKLWGLDPLTQICSHLEGWYKGIASDHGDPEHYWKGLGMNYTMDGFRQAVKNTMEDVLNDMTEEQFNQILTEHLAAQQNAFEAKLQTVTAALTAEYESKLAKLLPGVATVADKRIYERLGKQIDHLSDIPSKKVKKNILPLVEGEYVNGGTPAEEDATDIRLPWAVVRAVSVLKSYVDSKNAELTAWVRGLLEDEPDPEEGDPDTDCGETCPIVFPEDFETPGAGEE